MLSKGRKAFPVGTIRKFGGVDHIKTESGKWQRVKQGRKKKTKKKRARPKPKPEPKVELTEEGVIGTHVFRAFEKAIQTRKIKIAEAMQKALASFAKEHPDTVLSTGRTAQQELETLSKELEKIKQEPPFGPMVPEPRPPLEGTPQEMASKLVENWEKAIKQGTEGDHIDAKNAFDSFAELFPDVVLENGNTLKRQRQLLMYRWRNRVYKQRKKEGTTKKKTTKKKTTKKKTTKKKTTKKKTTKKKLKPKPKKPKVNLESGPFRIFPKEEQQPLDQKKQRDKLIYLAEKTYDQAAAAQKKMPLRDQKVINPAKLFKIKGFPDNHKTFEWYRWATDFANTVRKIDNGRGTVESLVYNRSHKTFVQSFPDGTDLDHIKDCVQRYSDANLLAVRYGQPPVDYKKFIESFIFEDELKTKINNMSLEETKKELKLLGFNVVKYKSEPIRLIDMHRFLYEVEVGRNIGITTRPMDLDETLSISFTDLISGKDKIGGEYSTWTNTMAVKKMYRGTLSYIHELWHNFDYESNGGTLTMDLLRKTPGLGKRIGMPHFASDSTRVKTPAAMTIAAFSDFLSKHETTRKQYDGYKKRDGDSRYADYHQKTWECFARFGEQLAAYRNMQAITKGEATQSTRLAKEYNTYVEHTDRYYTNETFKSLVKAWEAMPHSKDIEGMLSKSIFFAFGPLDLLHKSQAFEHFMQQSMDV